MNVFLILAAVYALLLAAVYAFQDRLVFFPSRGLVADPSAIGLFFEDVRLTTEDGETLHGWFVPAENARGSALFFHGNAGNISHRLETVAMAHRLGLSMFIIDYRGYGLSTGKPSEQGLYKDAQAAWMHLTRERGVPPGEIVAWGRSLGGPLAAWIGAEQQPAAVILESTFTSVPDMGSKIYPFLPVRLIARIRLPTKAFVSRMHVPVLVVHSREDEVAPFAMGQRLYETAREPKHFLEIGGSHNSGFLQSGKDYAEGLNRFLTPVLGGNGR